MLRDYEVVVPARDAAATIARTLESLLTQSHAPVRVSVVDDGSVDGTGRIAREHGVSLIRTSGIGLARAQNLALDRATSEAIAFVDADDLWNVDAGLLLCRALGFQDSAAAVAGQAEMYGMSDIDGARTRSEQSIAATTEMGLHKVTLFPLFWRNRFTKSATLFRTAALKSIGGYTAMPSAEDYDVLLRLAASRYELRAFRKAIICYRLFDSSTMSANAGAMLGGELQALQSVVAASAGQWQHLPLSILSSLRRIEAWRRTAVRELQYHDSLIGLPAPPVQGVRGQALGMLVRTTGGEVILRAGPWLRRQLMRKHRVHPIR